MRRNGFVLADEDVSVPGPSVETGADVPGYSGGAERFSERLFGMGPDAEKRIRTRRRGRQRSRASCGNRSRRTWPAGS